MFRDEKEMTDEFKCLPPHTRGQRAGFCKHHYWDLTWPDIQKRQCLNRRCKHLIKDADHSIWRQRDEIKEEKALKKDYQTITIILPPCPICGKVHRTAHFRTNKYGHVFFPCPADGHRVYLKWMGERK